MMMQRSSCMPHRRASPSASLDPPFPSLYRTSMHGAGCINPSPRVVGELLPSFPLMLPPCMSMESNPLLLLLHGSFHSPRDTPSEVRMHHPSIHFSLLQGQTGLSFHVQEARKGSTPRAERIHTGPVEVMTTQRNRGTTIPPLPLGRVAWWERPVRERHRLLDGDMTAATASVAEFLPVSTSKLLADHGEGRVTPNLGREKFANPREKGREGRSQPIEHKREEAAAVKVLVNLSTAPGVGDVDHGIHIVKPDSRTIRHYRWHVA